MISFLHLVSSSSSKLSIASILWWTFSSIVILANAQDHQAQWMSGKHGVGFRIQGGVGMDTAVFNVTLLVDQLKTELPEITWVLVGISSGAYGDRYISPHSILTDLNRGSTPRKTQDHPTLPDWFNSTVGGQNFTIEDYPERDLFSELATALQAEGFKVIAYMAAQGPTFLKHDETRAYDYDNGSEYVNSTYECNILTNGGITDGKCSPSARKWEQKVVELYGDASDANLQKAYAELIVGEYAGKFGTLVDGWWFDQGTYMNIPLCDQIIMAANPNAVVAYNKGQKVPLKNNNPPYEHFTSGHPNPIKGNNTPPWSDENLPMITSVEDTPDGFLSGSGGSYSLGHVYQMTNYAWNNGDLAWEYRLPQAVDWMSRVLESGGAWTWNVKRSFWPTKLHDDDVALLKLIYSGMTDSVSDVPSHTPTIMPYELPATLNGTTCDFVKCLGCNCCGPGTSFSPTSRQCEINCGYTSASCTDIQYDTCYAAPECKEDGCCASGTVFVPRTVGNPVLGMCIPDTGGCSASSSG